MKSDGLGESPIGTGRDAEEISALVKKLTYRKVASAKPVTPLRPLPFNHRLRIPLEVVHSSFERSQRDEYLKNGLT